MAKPRAKLRKSKLKKPKGKPGRKPLREKDPFSDPKWLTSVNVIALAYNDSTRWIQKLSKLKDGLPKEIKGKYHLVKVLRWTVEYYKSKVAELEAGGSRQEQQMRIRIMNAKARRQEVETAQALAEAIGIHDAISVIAPMLKDLQQAILGTSNRMAPILAHREERDIKKALDEHATKLLDHISTIPDTIKRTAKIQGKIARDVPDDEGTAAFTGEPMGGPVSGDRRGNRARAGTVAHGARTLSRKTHRRHVRHRP